MFCLPLKHSGRDYLVEVDGRDVTLRSDAFEARGRWVPDEARFTLEPQLATASPGDAARLAEAAWFAIRAHVTQPVWRAGSLDTLLEVLRGVGPYLVDRDWYNLPIYTSARPMPRGPDALSWDATRILVGNGPSGLRLVFRHEHRRYLPGKLPAYVVTRDARQDVARLDGELTPLKASFGLSDETYGRDWVVVLAASQRAADAKASRFFGADERLRPGMYLEAR